MGYERVCQRLLEYGILAPSIYNSQPWKFTIDGNRGIIGVYADQERARPVGIDEKNRDLFSALGACIENMVLAAPALGYETELSLNPKDPLVASLRLKPMKEAMPEQLFSSLLVQRPYSGLYLENSVQDLHFERLRNIPAFSNEEKIYFLNPPEIQTQLIPFLHDLSHEGSSNQILLDEGVRWIRTQPEPEDGLPMGQVGLPISVKMRFTLLHYFFRIRETREVVRQTLLRQGHGVEAPSFMLVTAEKSNIESYLRAGRWYSRLLLTLSEMELGAQALYLPVSLTRHHPQLLEFFKGSNREEPVFLVRWGRPAGKKEFTNFRRPLSQCLHFVGK